MIIRPLRQQDVKVGFSCGEPDLDTYFAKRAWPHECEGIARIFVLDDETRSGVVGFYSLSNKSLDREVIAPVLKRSLPRFPLPVTYLGCFAVSTAHQRQGHGVTLMGDALHRCLLASQSIGSVGVFLHSLSPGSTAFYRTLGFIEVPPLTTNHQPMFLAMDTLQRA